MANVFLNDKPRDIETAIMLEQAHQTNIGNAVAYTDGRRIFINTDDKLFDILPNYNQKMLKWLLWHERYHNELRHHKRYFDYLREVEQSHTSFNLNQNEVNIIMDILVHDSLEKLFPELVNTAKENCAQFRNQNSLSYTFTTYTLEDMLREYSDYKGKSTPPDESKSEGKDSKSKDDDSRSGTDTGKSKDTEGKKKSSSDSTDSEGKKGHGEGGSTDGTDTKKLEDGEPEIKKDAPEPKMKDAHDKTDWSKLEKIDSKEFIEDFEADVYIRQINELKRKKLRLSKLTETLNSLVTTTRKRTYTRPNPIKLSGTSKVILKGTTPGKAALYLCFDASGSMGEELRLFKDIISKAIPQAMETPTEWFSGEGEEIKPNPKGRNSDYYKGKFKDIMSVLACGGYRDDGDRTIELCYKAEQEGYSPIGITDGGGGISWSEKMLKQLSRTILIGDTSSWLKRAKEINPRIEIISLDDRD